MSAPTVEAYKQAVGEKNFAELQVEELKRRVNELELALDEESDSAREYRDEMYRLQGELDETPARVHECMRSLGLLTGELDVPWSVAPTSHRTAIQSAVERA